MPDIATSGPTYLELSCGISGYLGLSRALCHVQQYFQARLDLFSDYTNFGFQCIKIRLEISEVK